MPKSLLYGIISSENISYHSSTKNFGKFDLLFIIFLGFACFWAKKWTSADLMIFFFGLNVLLGRKLDICEYDDSQRTCSPFA